MGPGGKIRESGVPHRTFPVEPDSRGELVADFKGYGVGELDLAVDWFNLCNDNAALLVVA
jgi:hypothetical protein